MTISVESILASFSKGAQLDQAADFSVLDSIALGEVRAHLAARLGGARALLIPVPRVPNSRTRSTKAVLFHITDALEFSNAIRTWREPAVIIECRDHQLLPSFSAMVLAILKRLRRDTRPAWNDVAMLFAEWELLLSRRRLLDEPSEVGLWGELWCLAKSTRPTEMLAGWDGPTGSPIDFRVGDLGLEVKTTTRPFVHHASQTQVDDHRCAGGHFFMSLHVRNDAARGESLCQLVREAAVRLGNAPDFEEKLASVGYAREDDDAYSRRYALVAPPVLFPVESVPRVRVADLGVSHLRYRLELDPDRAVPENTRASIESRLGLSINRDSNE
jgi:hypothetical protein